MMGRPFVYCNFAAGPLEGNGFGANLALDRSGQLAQASFGKREFGMQDGSNQAAFDALLALSRMTLTSEQRAALLEGYRHLSAMLAHLHGPLTREAEPAVTFKPDAG
jgi:hypothetical protein